MMEANANHPFVVLSSPPILMLTCSNTVFLTSMYFRGPHDDARDLVPDLRS